jgi:hypothetical protein
VVATAFAIVQLSSEKNRTLDVNLGKVNVASMILDGSRG